MAITIIFGLPRAGKTALMTSLALQHMSGVNAHQNIRACNKNIASLNVGGFNYNLLANHLVYSDYPIYTRRNKIYSNEVDGFYLGLPNIQHPTLFLPPYSRIYLDEAQKYFNSRDGAKLSDFVSRFYELHGHNHYNVTLAVQRPKLIDLNIRELAVEVIEVVQLKHRYDHTHIKSSEWVCNVYDNVATAIAHIEGSKAGKHFTRKHFYYEGNVFKHYNSHNFMPAFFKDRYETPFDTKLSKKCSNTLVAIQEFNNTHDYVAPDTFYKMSRKK